MGRRSISALLFAGSLIIASTGSATVLDEPLCCFCDVPAEAGQAASCASLESRIEEAEFGAACDELGGVVRCLATPINGAAEASCGARLAEEGVSCPIRNGAPTASATGLGALALAFAAVGVFTVRRRSASASG